LTSRTCRSAAWREVKAPRLRGRPFFHLIMCE
jgi:hypothetical protein